MNHAWSDEFIKKLADVTGVEVTNLRHFCFMYAKKDCFQSTPIHKLKPYSNTKTNFVNTEEMSKRGLWLPSSSFRAEADIQIETSPHIRRMLQNTEILLPAYLKLTELMVKLSENKKLTDEELKEVSKLQKQLNAHIDKRTISID